MARGGNLIGNGGIHPREWGPLVHPGEFEEGREVTLLLELDGNVPPRDGDSGAVLKDVPGDRGDGAALKAGKLPGERSEQVVGA